MTNVMQVQVRKTGGTDPTGLHYVDKQEEGEKGDIYKVASVMNLR